VTPVSISAHVHRDLQMFTVDPGYELRHGDQPLGSLSGDPRLAATVECATGNGAWLFARLRGGNTEALANDAVLARYKANLLPGGTFELPDGTKPKLRAPIPRRPWRVPDVLAIHAKDGPWELRFGAAAREVYHLPLLTMFAFHAMLVELDRPSGGGGGDGPIGF
jgi:hypothetical protein